MIVVRRGEVRGTKTMVRTVQVIFGLSLTLVLGGSGDAWARAAAEPAAAKEALPVGRELRPAAPGRLLGTVTDVAGVPLDDSVISATGPSGTTLVVCDTKGRFEFIGLRPGRYLLRAHVLGFTPAACHVVQVRSGLATTHLVTLRRTDGASEQTSRVLTAGFVPPRRTATSVEHEAQSSQGRDADSLEISSDDAAEYGVAPHDDSEKAWWLRRARRSVLKNAGVELVAIQALDIEPPRMPRIGFGPVSVVQSATTDLSGGFPLSGQFHLLTRTSIHSPHDLDPSNILPGQIAYISLGGDEREQEWGIRGAVRTGDAGSWVLSGTYLTETSPTHQFAVGLSYSRQDGQTGNSSDSLLLGDLSSVAR